MSVIQTVVSFYQSALYPGMDYHNSHQRDNYLESGIPQADQIPGAAYQVVGFSNNDAATKLVDVLAPGALERNIRILKRDVSKQYGNRDSQVAGLGELTVTGQDVHRAQRIAAYYRKGFFTVLVEKAIDPTQPVYVRLANPAAPTATEIQGIGLFTDTDGGADTLELTKAQWESIDNFTSVNQRDANLTAELERAKISQVNGYSVAVISFNVD